MKLLISVFLPVFARCDHKIVLQIKTKQFYDHIIPSFGSIEKNMEPSHIYSAVR